MQNRQAILDDLRQRALWRHESAAEYLRRGDMRAYEYWAGQANGFEAAVYIIERYHPEADVSFTPERDGFEAVVSR
jgi:hypothetical protein